MTNDKRETKNAEPSLDTLVSLAKRRGFVFPSSEIYGGLAGFYDYGPYGTQLVRNLKEAWWTYFIKRRPNIHGLDSAIIQNPKLWEASGHVAGFIDPMVTCWNCNNTYRVDQIIGDEQSYQDSIKPIQQEIERLYADVDHLHSTIETDDVTANKLIDKFNKIKEVNEKEPELFSENDKKHLDSMLVNAKERVNKAKDSIAKARVLMDLAEYAMWVLRKATNYTGVHARNYLNEKVHCPNCGKKDWSIPDSFNMMFETRVGTSGPTAISTYLRPETAGGIFTNFESVRDTTRAKIPFGIAQMGKAFRNEISPREFLFRVREFEQMEIEYFVRPENAPQELDNMKQICFDWLKNIGLKEDNLSWYQHGEDERAHYAADSWDIQYAYPFGAKELWGIANRTDYDLRAHSEASGKELNYFDPEANTHFIPHVIEPSLGVERLFLAVLHSAYTEETVKDETRVVLKLAPALAPVDVAVLPLSKNEKLQPLAHEVYQKLVSETDLVVEYDETQSIGKRYRRQDEIGTPKCVTVDFESLDDKAVTIRDRDSMEQKRVSINALVQEVGS